MPSRVHPIMLKLLPAALFLLFALPSLAQQPPLTAAEIMARVAANQDRSESDRARFLYVQHARIVSRKGETVRCEEVTDSRVVPSDTGSRQQLLKLDGRLLVKGKYVTYIRLSPEEDAKQQEQGEGTTISIGDENTDRELVQSMRHNLTNTKTRDGIGAGLFPLTSRSQAAYVFTLLGQEHLNDRDVFHITFTLKDRSDYGWKGDAWIDTSLYQPVVVRTAMSRKLPFAVRTLLGTSLPGLGFTVVCAPQSGSKTKELDASGTDNEVWFPVSFGTEFHIKFLFFFSREISVSAENRNFELTHVSSRIVPVEKSNQPQF